MQTIRIAILTVSDRSFRGERIDASGPSLRKECENLNWSVIAMKIVPDDNIKIQETLRNWCDHEICDLILTTGGTGFSPRDVTPEATIAIIQRNAPGLAEAMRAESKIFSPHAILSRGVVGIRGRTIIVNLPGSPTGAVENFLVITPVIPHAIELLHENLDSETNHHKIYPIIQ
jgi:molybdopterin adenylyltransferase